MTLTVKTPADLLDHVGDKLGPTEWLQIDQDRINTFADATGDHQWIHVDTAKAADGPYGTTIAHGYLTLSLASMFMPELVMVEEFSMGINVGVNKVRFLNPVKCGSRIRATGELVNVEEAKGGIQFVNRVTIEIEGEDKPAAVIDSVSRFFP